MLRLSVVRKLGLVAVVALILVGGTTSAQQSDLSDENPWDVQEIGLPLVVVHEDAKLTASDAAGDDRFGWSVALSGDTAVVGAVADSHAGGAAAGSAYVFIRNGTSWSEQAKLTASDAAADDWFGYSVAISGDTAVVGANRDDHAGAEDAGSAYVFRLLPDGDVPAVHGIGTVLLLLAMLGTGIYFVRRRATS